MAYFIIMRLTYALALLLAVLFTVFALLHMTGDPASLMLSRNASPEDIEALREELGFNRNLLVQFGDFLYNAANGDFGNSFRYRQPAMQLVLQRLPATVELASAALILAVIIGVGIGVLGGTNPNTFIDALARGIGLLGQTIPSFWMGIVLVFVFSFTLGWFPSFGRETFAVLGLTLPNSSIVLPAFTLSLFGMGQLARFTRAAVLEVMGEEHVTTANSKGLKKIRIYTRYIFKNAAIPLVSIIGVQFSYLLSGSIYIETIFSWPGVGGLLAEAVSVRDFFLVQSIAFFTSIAVINLHLLSDIIYMLVDPRIRYR